MGKVIIDIGSGNIKAYKVDENNKVKPLYQRNIMFKAHYTNEDGISNEDKKELIETLKIIRDLAETTQIYTYATSVFRMLNENQLRELNIELLRKTGVGLNVVSQEQEQKYMANAVGNIPELDEPYLVCCVGGSSTEMVVMRDGNIIEQLTEEFATGDMLKKFPQIAQDKTEVKLEEMQKYIEDNFSILPKTTCKYAIFTGFHLMYNTVAQNKMEKNIFFERKDIPFYIKTEEFKRNNKKAIEEESLDKLKERYSENPNFMNGTRGANTIVGYILDKVGAQVYFPTDLNMIHGIVRELQERENVNGKESI